MTRGVTRLRSAGPNVAEPRAPNSHATEQQAVADRPEVKLVPSHQRQQRPGRPGGKDEYRRAGDQR